jgi:hypothetical protein
MVAAGTSLGARAHPPSHPADAPGNAWFQRTWERTDQPVSDGTVARTWMWGPQAFTAILVEDYDESPNGRRTVQYFDKSRMEITSDPEIEPDSVWYVTNGLLVRELISGRMQVGDNRFVQRAPAAVNVAGDADDPTGPTYATFSELLDAPALADGAPVVQRLSRDGTLTTDNELADYGVTGLYHVQVEGIDHEIASPFWEFMNSSGTVYEDGDYLRDDLFINPYYATGYPITEAYWATVKVAGEYRDVLMQCFERRCLTYTPGNSPGFETEAGNVGQHYYAWRYSQPGGDIVVNEILYWPNDGDQAWIELYNASDGPVDLTGWVVTNADTSRSAVLPDWIIPKGTFLRVAFGEGDNPSSFRDGATWYTGSNTRFFDVASDGVAIYHAGGPVGSPRDAAPRVTDASTIVDYVAWSYGISAPEGGAADDAIGAGIWMPDTYVPAQPRLGPARVHIVAQGEPLGRDDEQTDTNSPSDWAALGGEDSFWSTPGEANTSEGAFDSPSDDLPEADSDASWTIMAFFDGRDPALYRDFVAELNRMEDIGSSGAVNVVVQLVWYDDDGDLTGGRWYIEDDDQRALVTSPMDPLDDARHDLDPGDPDALAEFIEWAEDEYPAENHALVLGGHGRGWKALFPVGPQDDFLTMAELEDALSALGGPFDVLHLDAPLMAEVEVGYQIANRADMLVASQEIVWGAFPWGTFLDDLNDDDDMGAGEFADTLAQNQAALYDGWGFGDYTIASIDLDALANTLLPTLDGVALALHSDLEDYRDHDDRSDNAQLRLKHAVQEAAEDYADSNFKDLGDLADRIRDLSLSAALPADALLDLLLDDDVVRWSGHGDDHPASHGLSIYWPHDQDIPDPTPKTPGPGGERSAAPYDDPLFDPAEGDTHLYAHDADILIPDLRDSDHPMRDDPDFRFPDDSAWDEFLQHYYKPVADACVVFADGCVGQLDAPVGAVLQLNGEGSSDSDGPEGPSNDEPAHTTTGSTHYYWDFDSERDHLGGAPLYQEGVLYGDCDDEDCDRDAVDEPDDDLDAVGPTVEFTCEETGAFTIRLVVWDEHHDLPRHAHEDTSHNEGRHWLHFNVDDDTVVVRCFDDARKISEPDIVMPGDEFTYTITLPGSPKLDDAAQGFIHDQLPDSIELAGDGNIECSGGSNSGCGYDDDSRTVFWAGDLESGELATLRFTVQLVASDQYPDEVRNCASTNDGADDGSVCATTTVENPAGSLPPEATRRG